MQRDSTKRFPKKTTKNRTSHVRRFHIENCQDMPRVLKHSLIITMKKNNGYTFNTDCPSKLHKNLNQYKILKHKLMILKLH